MISNTFNFLLTLKNLPIHWRTLYNLIKYKTLYDCFIFILDYIL